MDVRNLKVRREIESLRYEAAVDLGDVVKGRAPEFVQDPIAFFERTYLTESMKSIVVKALMNLLGLKKVVVRGRTYEIASNLILLPSDLGGGKTHSLILLYHILKVIEGAKSVGEATSKVKILDEELASFISENWARLKELSPKVVIVDCKYTDLAPGPAGPIEFAGRRIKTLWGYLGYELGRYELVRSADERETAPYADIVFKMLNESRALILIDEVGRYYDESGLEPTKISAFLMNLAEVVSKYTIREVAVMITVPYEVKPGRVEVKAGMEYVHSPELVRAISEVLSRPYVEIIKPIETQDLAEILRRRLFAHGKGEFKKLVDGFKAAELSKEYPSQVRKILDDRNFWKKVEATYPFHPWFLEVLERLAYKLPYLQRTRDAIKIAVQTTLAIKEGLFDWLEDEVGLVMPYHIPVFIGDEVLDETVLRNAPGEYKIFQLILRSNVAEPMNYAFLKNMGREGFYESVVARPLRDLKEEDLRLGFKLASVIWLHSLVGLGLPMNMGDFPTTADLIYSVSPTELDVKGVLGVLRSVLPQLIVHGDPESEAARWFFTSIPSIEELVEILKRNVTDEMAKDRLAELLEWGLTGRRGRGRPPKGYEARSIFNGRVAVVKDVKGLSREVLESVDPALVMFADTAFKDGVEGLLRGRNNIVVLAPYVEGFDEGEELSPEDIKGVRELAGFKGRSVWDGLLEILRHYEATESITEANLKSFIGEKVAGGEEYKLLVEDVMKLLKGKVEAKKEYFYRHSWNLINRCYRRVYYHRLGGLRCEDGLALESDKPISPIVESFLSDKGLIPPSFEGDDLISMFRDYLGKDPKQDSINVGHLWSFIRTTDKANVPIVSHSMYVNAVKDLVRSLDYAVKVGGTLLWKPIFDSEAEAKEKSEGSVLLEKISDQLRRTGASWDDVELVYWENVFDGWMKVVLDNVPKGKVLKVIDRRGNVLDVRDVLGGFDPRNTIKSGKLFYVEVPYPVELKLNLPDELWEGKEYSGNLEIIVEGLDEQVEVKLNPDSGLEVEPREAKGKPPLSCDLKIRADKAGDYRVEVEVKGLGKLLDRRFLSIPVKGEWREREVVLGEGEPVKEGLKILYAETTEPLGVAEVIRLAKVRKGSIDGLLKVQSEEGKVELSIRAENPRFLESLWSPVNTLMRTSKGVKPSIWIRLSFKEEPELKEVASFITDLKHFKFKVKERVAGG